MKVVFVRNKTTRLYNRMSNIKINVVSTSLSCLWRGCDARARTITQITDYARLEGRTASFVAAASITYLTSKQLKRFTTCSALATALVYQLSVRPPPQKKHTNASSTFLQTQQLHLSFSRWRVACHTSSSDPRLKQVNLTPRTVPDLHTEFRTRLDVT